MVDVGAIAQASAQTLDTVMSNVVNYQTAKHTNEQMEKLANTAHYREMLDLRRAGLNPILTATGGEGAAVPNLVTPKWEQSHAAGAALNYLITKQQIKESNANIAQKNTETKKLEEDIRTNVTQQGLNSALTQKELAETSLTDTLKNKMAGVDTQLTSAQASREEAQRLLLLKQREVEAARTMGMKIDNAVKTAEGMEYMLDQQLRIPEKEFRRYQGIARPAMDWLRGWVPFLGDANQNNSTRTYIYR